MRVPISWLKEFVDIPIPVTDLAERLTFAGLEVASVETLGLPGSELPWDRERMLVGRILEVKPHPNADRLVLATVDYGAGRTKTVVTGAPNLKVGDHGQTVAFALEGARLRDAYGATPAVATLTGRKVRGVYSDGMVLSEKELGLSDDHEGVLLLDEATANLDVENAALVQDAVDTLMRGRTTLTITHRLNTAACADQIIVLANGRVAERGAHAGLVRQEGIYHRLVAAGRMEGVP